MGASCRTTRACQRLVGIVLAGLWFAHVAAHHQFGRSAYALWTCNVGLAILSLGLLSTRRQPVVVGALLLLVGIAPYVAFLLQGVESPMWTGVGLHFGGCVIGLTALRALEVQRADWFVAWLTVIGTMLLTRLITAPHWNVNFAFRSWFSNDPTRSSWSHLPYLVLAWGLGLWLLQRALAATLGRAAERSGNREPPAKLKQAAM